MILVSITAPISLKKVELLPLDIISDLFAGSFKYQSRLVILQS
ncbi:hypothetical protein ACVW2L_001518 [Mucilaginibacter sp. HD30]